MSNFAEIKGKQFNVLDNGFVRLVDMMGDDSAIVQAARVSYGEGTKAVNDDRGLIRYLMRHRHSTPFEMVELKFHVRVPMDTWRQWIRHRTANVNEYSTRYSEAIDAQQITQPDRWREQATHNKQGSGGFIAADVGEELSDEEQQLHRQVRETYIRRLAKGVAREQARKDLLLSTYTEAYWKIDLHNLLHFLALRMDDHAQEEIRRYATAIGYQIVQPVLPLVWEAFADYRLNAMVLTKLEIEALKQLLSVREIGAEELQNSLTRITNKREAAEAHDKILKITR
jgi:thymidylate synthase (FAD)